MFCAIEVSTYPLNSGIGAGRGALLHGKLKLTVNSSGEGVISGQVASSEDGTFLTFAEEPVTGSDWVAPDCRGGASITPRGHSEMHFRFVVVDGGRGNASH